MIESISVHKVGNKTLDDTLIISDFPVLVDGEDMPMLESYFTKHFKSEELFHFDNSEGENEVFAEVTKVFEDPEYAHEASEKLAQRLFDYSEHPRIKPGEFYLVYFSSIEYRNEIVQAVGLFKTETHEQFLKVYPKNEGYTIELHEGISTKKIDKGCIIYNTDKEDGYRVYIIDKATGGEEAHFWVDGFLQLSQVENNYFNTDYVMTTCRNFVTQQMPEEFDVTRVDQADLLNRSIDFFKQQEKFEHDKFCNQVFGSDELIESFEGYVQQCNNDFEVDLKDNFSLDKTAVRKQNRLFKSVIKLDKDFHIYVHGDRKKISREEDSKGKYYKIYFEEEK
ncbi:nucleoid-associated protein [Ornithobacterium rhinotracheale]|uniref:nucleoid-associated protein n=1 Tax=Ornithobacterium rhinotracheale TaxID=28251 RepID=UPI003FA4B412